MDQLHTEMRLTLSVGKINFGKNGAPTSVEDAQFSIEGSADTPQPLMQAVYGMLERAFNRIADTEEKKASEQQKGESVPVQLLIPPPVVNSARN